jgi:hypothetical protein
MIATNMGYIATKLLYNFCGLYRKIVASEMNAFVVCIAKSSQDFYGSSQLR